MVYSHSTRATVPGGSAGRIVVDQEIVELGRECGMCVAMGPWSVMTRVANDVLKWIVTKIEA